jgi:predicted O-methyltransferase YrrM
MNMHAAAAYATHLLTARSTAGHGVHSPLMFSFITDVIGGRADKQILGEIRNLRREMFSDSRVVRVTDLGAGSTVLRGKERSIRQIASVAALPPREVALLARMAANLDLILERVPDRQLGGLPTQGQQLAGRPVILELGTSLGISTLALDMAAPHRRVITVEGCPALAEIARENLHRHGADNVEVLNMEFTQALSYLKERGTKVGMAFIDGNHRGAALTEYVNTVRELGEEMIVVADDIHMNRDMNEAWQTLSASSVANASLETFRLGILFCLHNLTPGHYRIRY